jgi:hypothetical protein
MLRSMSDLEDYTIRATDGSVGLVKDFYFDDQTWVIRYLAIDTGNWLYSRSVLISPIAIGKPNWAERALPVSITREQVKGSPHIAAGQPISRQFEKQYLGYYRFSYYWDGVGLWGDGAAPGVLITGALASPPTEASREREIAYEHAESTQQQQQQQQQDHQDIHLRSCKAVVGCHIHASDGDIGRVQGMLVDEDTWAVRYLIVETGHWWRGHQVLIAPQWIEAVGWQPKWIKEVGWADAVVTVNLTRQAVQDAQPYSAGLQLERAQEAALHQHYGLPGYWTGELKQRAEK